MLHWPADEFLSRWKALEDIYAAGRVKAIGVSNFKKHHLETLLAHAKIKEIQKMINSQEFKKYPELFTSTTLALMHILWIMKQFPIVRHKEYVYRHGVH